MSDSDTKLLCDLKQQVKELKELVDKLVYLSKENLAIISKRIEE